MFFKLMVSNRYSGNVYCDSYWQSRKNAEQRMKDMQEDISEGDRDGEWHYYVASVRFSD